MKRVVIVCMSAVLLAMASAQAGYDSDAIWNSKTKVQVLKNNKGVYGFSVSSGNKKICDIELATGQKWVATEIKTGQEKEIVWLELKNIDTSGTNKTPVLGQNSVVRVSLNGEKQFPLVEFSLDLQSFNADAWQKALQPTAPLYYLRCTPASASMIVFGGMRIPTAKVEKYPLTRKEMAGEWGLGVWSYAPAMAGWAVPSIGLWDHESGLFVCYDFNLARHTDKTEKFIAAAYCAGIGDHRGEFFTLVHPYQKKWTKLAYPEKPEIIKSRFELLYALDISSDKDPTQFLQDYLYGEHQDILPYVPVMNALSWINKEDEWTPPVGLPRTSTRSSVIGKSGTTGLAGIFVIPGAEMLGNEFISDGIKRVYTDNNKAGVDAAKKQLEYLMKNTTWMNIDGDTCCAWMHPMTGSFKPEWGGDDVRGVHNEGNFPIAALMTIIYGKEGDPKYLPYIDGAYNWVKHFLFNRNGVCDLPWAEFCRVGTGGAESFLLNYRQVFKNDPVRGKNYDEALRLALTLLRKVTWFYTSNPDNENDIDPTFLNQGVNDCRWIGRVTWNECGWVVRSMVPIYCETGDPFLKYILRGCLERYWIGFRDDGGIAENMQIFGEIESRGLRTAGFSDVMHGGNVRRYALPIGDASLRVCVGEKAAIAFCKESPDYDIAEYCYEQNNNFSFKLVNLRPDKGQNSVDVIASFPFRDLRGKKVYLNGKELPSDRYEYNSATDGEDVYVWGMSPGDVVMVGEIKNAKPFAQPEIKYRKPLSAPTLNINNFECLNLYPNCNTSLELRFERQDNWFGFLPAEHIKNGIPFYLVDPDLNAGKCVVKGDSKSPSVIEVNKKAKALFLFFGTQKKDYEEGKSIGKVTVYFANGEKLSVDAKKVLSADITDLMPLRTWDLYMLPVFFNEPKDIQKVAVQDGALFALTVASQDAADRAIVRVNGIMSAIEQEKKESLARQEKMKKGTALMLKSEYAGANTYEYTYLYVVNDNFEIPEESFLEYDMFIPLDSANFSGGVDLAGGTLGNLRDKRVSDDKGSAHPGQAPRGAKGEWCHRKISLKDLAGASFKQMIIAVDGQEHQRGTYKAFFKDIQITDGKGKVLIDLFTDKKEIPSVEPGIHAVKGMTDWEVKVVPAIEVKNPVVKKELKVIAEPAGIINPDFSFEKQNEFWGATIDSKFTSDEVHSGKTAVDLSCKEGGVAVVSTNYKGSMIINVKPNTTYRVSFWAKCKSNQGEIRTNFYAGGGYDFKQIPVPLETDGEWHKYEVDVPTGDFPVDKVQARVFKRIPPVLPVLRFWTLQKPQSVYIDDVEVKEKM